MDVKINFNKDSFVSIDVEKQILTIDTNHIGYHRSTLFTFHVANYDIQHIRQNIKNNVKITNKRILEWIEWIESRLKSYDKSVVFLKEKGEEVKQDYLTVAEFHLLKKFIIERYWWRLGLYGIKERYRYFKQNHGKSNRRMKKLIKQVLEERK